MTSACTTMPRVVPMPRTRYCSRVSDVRPPFWSADRTCMATPMPMTTRLFATGAQAGMPNFSLVFRMAPNNAAIP